MSGRLPNANLGEIGRREQVRRKRMPMRWCRSQKPAKSTASAFPVAAGCHPAVLTLTRRLENGSDPKGVQNRASQRRKIPPTPLRSQAQRKKPADTLRRKAVDQMDHRPAPSGCSLASIPPPLKHVLVSRLQQLQADL
jgi:hypothetical protein